MINLLKTTWYLVASTVPVFLIAIFAVPLASAQALDVQFEQTPLFSNTDIAPGHGVARSVIVTNNSPDLQKLYTSARNTSSTGLADVMVLSIEEVGGPVLMASTTFSTFFSSAPIYLGQFAPGDVRTYIYNAYFDEQSDNLYQATTMKFDIAIGFMDGSIVTDTGGGGEGNSGSGGLPTKPTDTAVTPPGQVAGAATSSSSDLLPLPTPTFLEYLQNNLVTAFDKLAVARANVGSESNKAEVQSGQVAGATTTESQTDTTQTASPADAEAAASGEEVVTDCTFLWLLLLAGLSVLTAFVDDILRHKNKGKIFKRLFVRQLTFSGLYVVAVLGAYFLSWLDSIWYWLAAAWALMQIIDYRSHAKEWEIWNHAVRLAVFGGGALVLLVLSLTIGWPCSWWPFALIAIISLLTYLLQ